MQRLLFLGTIITFAIASAISTRAQDPPPPTAAPTTTTTLPETEHQTTVAGDIPLEPGRWLVIVDLLVQTGARRTVPAFFEVSDGADGLEIIEVFADPPGEFGPKIDQLNAAGERWEPTDEELVALDGLWSDLGDNQRGVARVHNELWGRSAFTDEIKAEPKTKDALWVLRQGYQFVPGGQRPVRQVNVFGVAEQDGRRFSGAYEGVAVAVAPFPVPIAYQGEFRMIPLHPEPEKGLLARIADVFAGCGR